MNTDLVNMLLEVAAPGEVVMRVVPASRPGAARTFGPGARRAVWPLVSGRAARLVSLPPGGLVS
ncbi:hypothetical protein [Streptomyces globisporus]